MSLTDTGAWSADWAWGIALILITIVTHVVCIGFINEKITVIANDPARHHRPRVTFFLIVGTVTILLALLLGADASWAAANACLQTHGGYGFASEYDVERKFRETRLFQVAPISTNLILSYVGEHVLGMPRSF